MQAKLIYHKLVNLSSVSSNKYMIGISLSLMSSARLTVNNTKLFTINGQRIYMWNEPRPFHVNKFLKHLVLNYPDLFNDFCQMMVGGEIWFNESQKHHLRNDTLTRYAHDGVYDVYSGLSYDNELQLNNWLKRSNPKYVKFLRESVFLTKEQISQVKDYIKENLDSSNSKVIKLEVLIDLTKETKEYLYSLKDTSSVKIDLYQDIENFDPKVRSLFLKLIEVEFPQSILNKVKAQLMLDDNQAVLLMIEYIKFLILRYFFPSQTY